MLEARDKNELLSALSSVDIAVPPRASGRTKEHTERYAICHLLSALAVTEFLQFPIGLSRRERPDLLLKMLHTSIGIEHTEAVSHNAAHAAALRETGYGPEMSLLRRRFPDDRKLTSEEMINELGATDVGDGWAGNSAEVDWVQAMLHFIERKAMNLVKPGYDRFDEDWLLIYDNWSLPALDRQLASKMLAEAYESENIPFDRVFVLSGSLVIDVCRPVPRLIPQNDIW